VVTIGKNIDALKAGRRFGQANDSLSQSLERLSSGLRINRASDDAAGLALATSLKSSARIYAQAARNVNDGISLLNIASGALDALAEITSRQLELAEQATNGVLSLSQRQAINSEANALVQEFNRVVSTTRFNGLNLLDGSFTQLNIQAGEGQYGTLSSAIATQLDRLIGTGVLGTTAQYNDGSNPTGPVAADLNGDGILDIVTTNYSENGIRVLLGTGGGAFGASTLFTTGNLPVAAELGDVNGDGKLDIIAANYVSDSITILLGNGNGTFLAPTSLGVVVNGARALHVRDINGDGKVDIMAAGEADDVLRVFVNNGSGGFTQTSTYSAGLEMHDIATGDLNGDGQMDMVVTSRTNDQITVFLGHGDGTFTSNGTLFAGDLPYGVEVVDLNHDGILDLINANAAVGASAGVLLGNGDGTFKARVANTAVAFTIDVKAADINGDGYEDLVASSFDAAAKSIIIYIANGDGTFKAGTTYPQGGRAGSIALFDANQDGVLDIATTDVDNGKLNIYISNTTSSWTTPYLNLALADTAREAMVTLQATLQRVENERGQIAAFGSRLEHALNIVTVMRENYMNAGARILDADIAEEAAEMVRKQILSQSAAAILAQANQVPQLVLKLLEGIKS